MKKSTCFCNKGVLRRQMSRSAKQDVRKEVILMTPIAQDHDKSSHIHACTVVEIAFDQIRMFLQSIYWVVPQTMHVSTAVE